MIRGSSTLWHWTQHLKEGVGLIIKSGLADLGVFTTKPEKPAVLEDPKVQVNAQKSLIPLFIRWNGT